MSDIVKSWIEERQATLAHVLKHPHPDPAAEWAQTALDALSKVLELHTESKWGFCTQCMNRGEHDWMQAVLWPCPTVRAIGGAIND